MLIILGASLGWLGSILGRTEAPGSILRQIAIGVAAALVAGLVMNTGSLLGGLSVIALGSASVTAIALLLIYHFAVERRSDAEA
ncbi:MAG: hypothetical protein AAFR64_10740 [Pseudomonadota bacterium]